jgi:glycosyltransferase involved in cell wall biosynthesis
VVGAGSVGGVDTVRFSPDRFDRTEIAALRESLTIPDTHFIALTVGRICVDKGLEELKSLAIELAGENLMFVLVGSVEEGNEVLAGEVFSLANVRYVPFVSEVARYFALADVHLFLSHREGFGNVALEAAACGIPTIAFDVVGVRDSVVDGVSGLRMRFGDIGAVEMAIKEALDDPHAFRARFSGARKWVETIYSSGRVWQSYLALFEEYRRR